MWNFPPFFIDGILTCLCVFIKKPAAHKNGFKVLVCKTFLQEPQYPQSGLYSSIHSIQKYESASQVRVQELKTFAINKPVLSIYPSCAFMGRLSKSLLLALMRPSDLSMRNIFHEFPVSYTRHGKWNGISRFSYV